MMHDSRGPLLLGPQVEYFLQTEVEERVVVVAEPVQPMAPQPMADAVPP